MEVASSSIAVVEDFYGEQISYDLLRKIRGTPYDQLLELAFRMVNYSRTLERARLKIDTSSDKSSNRPEQVVLWDDIYFRTGRDYSLSESPDLKYALMYTDRIVVPDFSLDWAEGLLEGARYLDSYDETDQRLANIPNNLQQYVSFMDREDAGPILANALRNILPVAPLVRQGILIAAPSSAYLDTSFSTPHNHFPLRERCDLDGEFSEDIFFQDPYLAWLFITALGVEPWELEALDLHRPQDIQDAAYHFITRDEGPSSDALSNAYKAAYGSSVPLSNIEHAVMLNVTYREAALVPMTGSSIGRTHLTRSAKVLVDGLTAPDVAQHDAIMAATKYRVPPVANVSLEDLIRLRLQEEIYQEVRECLISLVNSVAGCHVSSYHSYEIEVGKAADDLVRPTYEKLNSRRHKNRLASLVAGYAAGGMITMAFNAIASMLTGPLAIGGHKAASIAGQAGRRAVSRRIDPQHHELAVANSVLLSILDHTGSEIR